MEAALKNVAATQIAAQIVVVHNWAEELKARVPSWTSTLAYGRHTLTLEVSGGDGCVEVDVVTLSPDGAGASKEQ